MINEPIKHATPHPHSASAGGNNAYYLRHCPVVERGPAYTACLSRLNDIDAGRVNERTSQCDQAVRQNRCIAHGMREQERLAGQAMFFFPRPANKPFVPFALAGDFGVLVTNHTDPAIVEAVDHPGRTRKPVARAKSLDEHLTEQTTSGVTSALNSALTDLNEQAPIKGGSDEMKTLVAEAVKVSPPVVLPPTVKPTRPAMLLGETPLQYARRLAAEKTQTPT